MGVGHGGGKELCDHGLIATSYARITKGPERLYSLRGSDGLAGVNGRSLEHNRRRAARGRKLQEWLGRHDQRATTRQRENEGEDGSQWGRTGARHVNGSAEATVADGDEGEVLRRKTSRGSIVAAFGSSESAWRT